MHKHIKQKNHSGNYKNRRLGLYVLMTVRSFSVTAKAQSGGRKVGDASVRGGNFPAINIVGMTTNKMVKFSVDLLPPTHCLLQPSAIPDDCLCFPIYLDQDVTTVSCVIQCKCFTRPSNPYL